MVLAKDQKSYCSSDQKKGKGGAGGLTMQNYEPLMTGDSVN